MGFDHDFVIIGSGFGGSVSALRLAEKGYDVVVLEAGLRYGRGDFARSTWDLRRWLWLPRAGCYGIQRMTLLDDVFVLSGAGVGGGSLVYGNTLMEPPDAFYSDPQWSALDPDWKARLAPFYQTARRMLGVVPNPTRWEADEALRDFAVSIGREEHFAPTPVGVFFGEPGREAPDPFFGGEGPPRVGCARSGHCFVGCNGGGKNSLDRNYLHLAEGAGARIVPNATVTSVAPLAGGGYRVAARRTTGLVRHPRREWSTRAVVLAAGALGTNRLLLRCRDRGLLPGLSQSLGTKVRTNSEALTGVRTRAAKRPLSPAVAITSSLRLDDDTHVEPVRYPPGSDVAGLLDAMMVDGGGRAPRWVRFVATAVHHPVRFLRTLWPFGWAARTVILLVMQNVDNHMELRLGRRWWWPFERVLRSRERGGGIPTYLPQANDTARALARRLGGEPVSSVTEVLLDVPATAHLLGGCPIGEGPASGVVDEWGRVFGYDGLYVADGAMVPANPGVNPSLTITALAEHAMSRVPTKAREA